METRRALLGNHGAPVGKFRIRLGSRPRIRGLLIASPRVRHRSDFEGRQDLGDLRLFRGDGLARVAGFRPDGPGKRVFTAGARHPLFLSR